MPSLKLLNLWRSLPDSAGRETKGGHLSPGAHAGEYKALVQLLCDRLEYILSICAITDAEFREKTIVAALHSLSRKSEYLPLRKLSEVINYESKNKSKEGYGHKILHAYSRIYFSDYLRNTLGGVLSEVLKEKSQELRIDPDQSFVDMAIKIIDRIIQAMPELPDILKETCLDMHKAVSDTKPIGDLLLRDFFCPAISFADFYGIIPKVTKQERTVLQRVAKIITQVNHHHKVGLDVSKLQTKMEELFHIAANLPQPATLVKKKRRTLRSPVVGESEVSPDEVLSPRLNTTSPSTSLFRKFESLPAVYISSEAKEEELYNLFSSAFCYHPMTIHTPSGHVVRTEEITSRLMMCKNKDEFLAFAHRCGEIVVPMDWVRHKLGMKLRDVESTYSKASVDDKQIQHDVQRDHLRINGTDFVAEKSVGKIVKHLAYILVKYKLIPEKEAESLAKTLIHLCGRTMAGGDSFEAVHLVYGGRARRKSMVNDTLPPISLLVDSDFKSPITISVNETSIVAQLLIRYKLMDLTSGDDTIWFGINAKTRLIFSPPHFNPNAFIHLEPDYDLKNCGVPHMSKLDVKRLTVLRGALSEIYENKVSIL